MFQDVLCLQTNFCQIYIFIYFCTFHIFELLRKAARKNCLDSLILCMSKTLTYIYHRAYRFYLEFIHIYMCIVELYFVDHKNPKELLFVFIQTNIKKQIYDDQSTTSYCSPRRKTKLKSSKELVDKRCGYQVSSLQRCER